MKNLGLPKGNHDKKYTVTIPVNNFSVEGILRIPHNPQGVVLFDHGSGSSRYSPRNNFVAGILREARIGPKIRAIVSRGGRPDLAMDEIEKVKSSTLLIVRWFKKYLSHGFKESFREYAK